MDEKMKKYRRAAICYFLAAAAFYFTSVMNFIQDTGLGAMYLCLGSAFLLLGGSFYSKMKNDAQEEKGKGDPDEK